MTDFAPSEGLSLTEQAKLARERRARLWGGPTKPVNLAKPAPLPDHPDIVIENGIEWRRCARAPLYAVSSEGGIRRIDSGHRIKIGDGQRVSLTVGEVHRSYLLSTLVAEAFVGPRPGRAAVRYRDGDRTNARASNLYYASKVYTRSGEGNVRAKLTDAQVIEIRALNGTIPQKDICARFGISKVQVWRIVNGYSRREDRP